MHSCPLMVIMAMPCQGAIWLDATLAGENGLAVTVQDTGIGIPERLLGSIFDPFKQVSFRLLV